MPDLFPTIAVVSIGMGMTFVPLTLLATTNVERGGRRARIRSVQHLAAGRRRTRARDPLDARRVADEHLLAAGWVVGRSRDSALTRGYHVAFAVGAAMLLAALVVLAVTIRKQDVELIDSGEASLTPA